MFALLNWGERGFVTVTPWEAEPLVLTPPICFDPMLIKKELVE